MRAITVRQPWALAIMSGGKDVENRSRNIAGDYRGLVAIHAGLAPAQGAPPDLWTKGRLHYGSIVGVVNLWAVHPAGVMCCPNRGAKPYGSPWAMDDHWHLCLSGPRNLPEPVPAKGRLGLWTLDAETEAQVRQQVVVP